MAFSAVSEAFEAAKKDFTSSTKTKGHDFSHFTSIQDVYSTTEDIQKEQSKSGTLRNLRKIQPYLDTLTHYAGVIETFAQVKPDMISLIWGPIKTILLITKTYVTGYDSILNAMEEMGTALPQFQRYAEIFGRNDHLKHVLCLFYKDILEFHMTVLDFFHLNRRRVFFESIWPRYQGKIQVIVESIASHRNLMNSEATLAHITQAEASRVAAYRAYERDQAFQERQDFQVARSSVLPVLYDDELERIRKKCSVQAGDWLRQIERYQHWLNPTDTDFRLFWLQGIPGAGKSFLAALITRQIQTRKDPLAFAFLSYQSRNEISTLKVLHSFIFQIATDIDQLQPMVCFAHGSKARQLSSSVEFSKVLLGDMLKTLPATYITLDGLDEIPVLHCIELVNVMLELHDTHDNLHVLFSSRAENDITRRLDCKVQPVHVHHRNSQDIQAYVEKRSMDWLSGLEVDPDDAKDIRTLMENIGKQSKGMFMYARLVCDNLELQSDLDSIKAEASNLPAGLNEAYGRILSRISQELEPHERIEARKFLEWVGCSMSPMSKKEIHLALFVARGGNPAKGCRKLFTNITYLCGPIIEDMNGFVQFVHFSAREFLFHQQSGPYLNKAETHDTLASTCVRYLCSNCFDLDLDDKVMSASLVNGCYVLENYACLYWLEHVKKCAILNPHTLRENIQLLADRRRNFNFGTVGHERYSKLVIAMFQNFPMDLQDLLIDIQWFYRSRKRTLCFEECDLWKNLDPLTTSTQQSQIRACLERRLCPATGGHRLDCDCSSLRKLYGGNLWRCSRPGCPRFRNGFENKRERDSHILAHKRPFKCSFVDCTYHDLGFVSKVQLDNHTSSLHKNGVGNSTTRKHDLGSEAEVKLFLEDAVVFDDLDMVRDLRESVRIYAPGLINVCIAKGSSISMLKLVLEISEGVEGRVQSKKASTEALNKASPEHVRLLLHYNLLYTDERGFLSFWACATRASPQIFELLAAVNAPICGSLRTHIAWKVLFNTLLPAQPDDSAEANTLQCMQAMGSILTPTGLSICLWALARRCCSVLIARFCVGNGADVDEAPGAGPTPLWNAAGNASSKEAAEFMKLLLESGANPEYVFNGAIARERAGAKNIHRWLGVAWDELVEQGKNQR